MSNNHLTSLTSLITSAVWEIIATYTSIGRTVPSLDSVEPGPFDGAAEDVPERLARAVKVIEAACTQLVCTVSNPSGIILDRALAQPDPSCLAIVTDARIADLLAEKPDGMHVNQLAEASGLKDSDKLGRVLRLLAAKHIFREVKPNIYANNRLSVKLISKNAVSDLVGLMTDEVCLGSAHVNETYFTKPRTPDETAFQRSTGHTFLDWYKLPENKEKAERFSRAMVARIDFQGNFLPKVYPWTRHPPECTVCDVAGGNGHFTMELLKRKPHFKVILQDQVGVIEQAKKYWAKEYPQAIEEKKVEYVPFNFLADQAVKGCDVYYIKSVLHDWPDAQCLVILQNIRNAMKPESRLIIHEVSIHTAAYFAQCEAEHPPEPLLPDWGAPAAKTYKFDFVMMALLGTRARTLEEVVALCERCGLRFQKLYPSRELDMMEFAPV